MSRYPFQRLFFPMLIVGVYGPLAALLIMKHRGSMLVPLAVLSAISIMCGIKLFLIMRNRFDTEKLYRICLDQSKEAFLLIDSDGRITKLNSRAEKIPSQDLARLKQVALSGNVSFLKSNSKESRWEEAFENKPENSPVLKLDLQRGSLFFIGENPISSGHTTLSGNEALESRVKERTLELEALNAALRNEVAEKRRADEILRRTKEDYELIFHSVPAMIWYKDAHNRIIRANRWAAESIGKTVKELEGLSTFDLYPEDAKRYYEDDLQVIRTGKPKIGIVEQYQPFSGPKLWVRTDKIPYLDETGAPGGVIVFSVDITDNKKAEAKLLETAEKLKNMNEEMDKFNCLVSHDLQEPLRTIFGFSDLLLKAENKDKARDYASRIKDAAARIREQLKDLLLYAKSHVERESLFQEVSLERVLRDVALDLSRLIEETNTKLRIEALPHIRGNSSQLYHLFLNLLTNAIKFRKEGQSPEITITSEKSESAFEVIRVRDNGIGFDARQAERIFAPFQKLHSREKYPGSGMGLSLCRKIIQQHGGTLTAAGNIDEGAVFEICLPKSTDRTA